jgi:hypothetical protein
LEAVHGLRVVADFGDAEKIVEILSCFVEVHGQTLPPASR